MYDILIKDAIIIDGSNSAKYRADVGICDGKIDKIDKNINAKKGKKVIFAKDMYLTPGFIDLNNHSDTFLTLFTISNQDSLLRQGITTILGGNCGSSLAPLISEDGLKAIQKWTDPEQINLNWLTFQEFIDSLKKIKIGVNFASLVGHSTLRRGLIKDEFRELKPKELKIIIEMLKTAMKQGAFGFSTGLAYSHAKMSTTKEIIELAKTVKAFNGLYTSHIRGEAEELIPAIEETIEIAKKTGVNTEISHLKAMGENHWPNMKKAIEMIEKTKANINFDVYPYTVTGSVLYILLPDWVAEGGKTQLLKRLRDASIKEKVIREMQEKKSYEYGNITIATSPINRAFIGKKITEIAKAQEVSVEEAIINLLLISEGRVNIFLNTLSEENIKAGLTHKLSFVASDSAGYNIDYYRKKNDLVHPRCFGAFPRFLSKYVEKEHLLSWEEAIYKITHGPAKKIGLKNRGLIKKDYWADLVLINPNEISDKGTFENPYQFPTGIKYVIVNGELAVENEQITGKKTGQVLKRI
ncbi:MAG TPA: amidohydrolase family protein [Candidatus Portnoybacteria bacterium]|jgi:N-acyl-D-amino-acid deacylase|nr:amidohydrolase family protein [Candidatus Portnoybacteria bacterium]MDD5752212.1 amidohydrolase family protein [Candidatus Portnoybacteria bacterium]HOZ16578.1 amidohydrolase family protein [Candidatus Portnoybacteria bacterium]HPH52205.1 amidohydrolase family protein [Candidatus Portnoybacteria bacterium]HPJ80348.1 amidohydrolase family protein [Candidatus Portnoybacteria bacterium]